MASSTSADLFGRMDHGEMVGLIASMSPLCAPGCQGMSRTPLPATHGMGMMPTRQVQPCPLLSLQWDPGAPHLQLLRICWGWDTALIHLSSRVSASSHRSTLGIQTAPGEVCGSIAHRWSEPFCPTCSSGRLE